MQAEAPVNENPLQVDQTALKTTGKDVDELEETPLRIVWKKHGKVLKPKKTSPLEDPYDE